MSPLRLLRSCALLLGSIFLYSSAAQAQDATLTGLVTDARTGEALPAAAVQIEGTALGGISDNQGRYALRGLPAGAHTVVVSYLGYETATRTVTLDAGATTTLDVALDDAFAELDGVVVSGLRQGQARALNEQRTAANIRNVVAADLIGRFPDQNVAEALQRIPGISIQRDQGEGRYVQIRGTNPNLSNISINGEQIPSPEGDVRFVALDAVPADVLSQIEVVKAITPDMDGDAIGGSVNLVTRTPVSAAPVFRATVAGTANRQVRDQSPLGGQLAASYGRRLGPDERFGFLVGGSFSRANRASDNNEMAYGDGALEEMELRDYELTRQRLGLTGAFDVRLAPASRLYLNTVLNYFDDQEFRRSMKLEPDVIEREVKDRLEYQRIASVAAGGEHALGPRLLVDYQLAWSYADQVTPSDYSSFFVQEFDGDVISFDASDPDYPRPVFANGENPLDYGAYAFDGLESGEERTTDRNATARLNVRTPLRLGTAAGEAQAGGLFRAKRKTLDPTARIFGYNGSTTYADLLSDFEDDDYLGGRYDMGQTADPDAVRALFESSNGDFELDEGDTFLDSHAEDFEATENTGAGYAMARLRQGRLSGLVGARYERVGTEYLGYEVVVDEEGEVIPEALAIEETRDFGFFLPMVHLTYALTERANLRAAWTNSFAKPNYFDLAPYRIVNREDDEIELGNPDLNPARAMNFDLMGEYYASSIGVVSLGLFYKRIEDFIYARAFPFDDPALADYAGYDAVQPVNGETADLFGVEVNLQQQLTFLPGFASGLGVYANYTYTWSEARLRGESDDPADVRTVALPGQTENVANLALSYEKYGFSGRLSMNYAGAFIDEIRDAEGEDRVYDERLQLDLSASQEVGRGLQVFVEALNLTNAPLRYYNGVTSRPEQQEFYAQWVNLGVKYDL